MNASDKTTFPVWFKMLCCVIPLLSLFAICIGAILGVSVNPAVTVTLGLLAWRVIACVLSNGHSQTMALPQITSMALRSPKQHDRVA